MKKKIIAIALIFSACQQLKTPVNHILTPPDPNLSAFTWEIGNNGEGFLNTSFENVPYLDFKDKELQFFGNDGCNKIFGRLTKLTNTEMVFGEIASTKMACRNPTVAQTFQENLSKVNYYGFQENRLVLKDSNKTTLLVLQKLSELEE